MTYRTVWKGEAYTERIGGQTPSMFYASDGETAYYAVPDYENVPWLCGKCGVCINKAKSAGWPIVCMNGHVNYRK